MARGLTGWSFATPWWRCVRPNERLLPARLAELRAPIERGLVAFAEVALDDDVALFEEVVDIGLGAGASLRGVVDDADQLVPVGNKVEEALVGCLPFMRMAFRRRLRDRRLRPHPK